MASTRRSANEELIDVLNRAASEGVLKETIVETVAPCKMQAKRRSDGSYRTASVAGGEEFAPSGARMHARGDKIIFEFRSIDPNDDYAQFELDDTKAFATFPDLESNVIRALGFEATDTDDIPIPFAQIKPLFLKKAEAAEKKRIEDEMAAAALKAEEKKKADQRKAERHYENDEQWGIWG